MLHCSVADALVSKSFCSSGTRNEATPFLLVRMTGNEVNIHVVRPNKKTAQSV